MATTHKIFGIGMPKTGTTSLTAALRILGFRTEHSPRDPTTVAELRAGNYSLSILSELDALTDIPIPAIFPQLDQMWPGSKFILTVREFESWLASCRAAPFNQIDESPQPGSTRDFYRVLLYGCSAFSELRFTWVYRNHIKLVTDYFSGGQEDRLLTIDICGGEGWDKLCPFLDVPVPDQEFPHRNRRGAPSSW